MHTLNANVTKKMIRRNDTFLQKHVSIKLLEISLSCLHFSLIFSNIAKINICFFFSFPAAKTCYYAFDTRWVNNYFVYDKTFYNICTNLFLSTQLFNCQNVYRWNHSMTQVNAYQSNISIRLFLCLMVFDISPCF